MEPKNLIQWTLMFEETNVLLSALSTYLTSGDAAAASDTLAYRTAKTLRRELMALRSQDRNLLNP